MTLYKLTATDGSPLHGGRGRWPLPKDGTPGHWRSVRGQLIACEQGLHLLRRDNIVHWLHEGVLWEAEADMDGALIQPDKVVVRRARLLRQAAVLDARTLRLFAADCAERVLPLFEARYPDDDRPRRAIETARRYAEGQATKVELRAAAAAAYAYAAAAAAYAYAAYAAAAYAERRWQTDHLALLLGLSDG